MIQDILVFFIISAAIVNICLALKKLWKRKKTTSSICEECGHCEIKKKGNHNERN